MELYVALLAVSLVDAMARVSRVPRFASTACFVLDNYQHRAATSKKLHLVQGELSFERLLRVDGSFKGKLISTGDLVVGAKGVVRGSITDIREARKFVRANMRAPSTICVWCWHRMPQVDQNMPLYITAAFSFNCTSVVMPNANVRSWIP